MSSCVEKKPNWDLSSQSRLCTHFPFIWFPSSLCSWPLLSLFSSSLPINFGYPFLLCNVYFYFLQNYLKLNVYQYPHLCIVCILAFCVQAKCSQHATLRVWMKERETDRPFQNGSIYSLSALKIHEPWPYQSSTPNYHFGFNTKLLINPLRHENRDTHSHTPTYTL